MRRKFKFKKSSIVVFALVLTLIFPHVSFAGTKYFTIYNSTSGSQHAHTFSYTNPKASCTDRPAQFSNYMTANLGTVTNSYIRVNKHKVSPTISSGVLHTGTAFLTGAGFSQQQGQYSGFPISSGQSREYTWNRNVPITSSNKSVTIRQVWYPSGYAPSDTCIESDSFIFTHGSLSASDPINNLLNSTFIVNTSEVQKAEKIQIIQVFGNQAILILETCYKAFVFDNNLVEISVHDIPVEVVDAIDTKAYGNVNVYITKNFAGENFYTLEIYDNGQYIYIRSTIDLEDLLTLVE